jgi:hypothetical protein
VRCRRALRPPLALVTRTTTLATPLPAAWMATWMATWMAMASAAYAAPSSSTQRFALLVAAHDGGPALSRLRYAGRDAARIADVLVDIGGFARSDVVTLIDVDAGVVEAGLESLRARVADAHGRGDEAVVVVYYSGHAADGVLRLGASRLSMAALREGLARSAADVRLGFVDACGAGAITRDKGATLAPPFVVKVDETPGPRGQVVIASSSSSEASQESDDIQGSFFTHYLTTGLRGDADRDDDGRVTLDEAYAYAYGRTVAATAATRAGAQHPTFAVDLQGAGDVVLTMPGGADVVVQFPDGLQGRYFVVDLDRQRFVGEVDKRRGDASSLALPRGRYAIKKRTDEDLLITRVQARDKGVIVVDDAAMEHVAFADDYAKGSPIALTDTVTRALGLSLSLAAGVHGAVDVVDGDDGGLFPTTPVLSLAGRVHGLLNRDLDLVIDVGGGRVAGTRVVDGGALGVARYATDVGQLHAGVAALWTPPWSTWLDGGLPFSLDAGPRVAGYFFVHDFVGDARPAGLSRQTYMVFSPGLQASVGWSFLRGAHVELTSRAHYLPYTVDSLRHLLVLEAVASVWLDL